MKVLLKAVFKSLQFSTESFRLIFSFFSKGFLCRQKPPRKENKPQPASNGSAAYSVETYLRAGMPELPVFQQHPYQDLPFPLLFVFLPRSIFLAVLYESNFGGDSFRINADLNLLSAAVISNQRRFNGKIFVMTACINNRPDGPD